ncbi:ArsJ-associated glyceraldehyde-3-phosphate dehydrogenase [Rhodovulum sp. DZ06]|uniref:ArsJ-associated glyceraldehyde-3-phosphate dehydrogenase n=1 Tax=Rhodovulum sp. DZ06 TaxID=3425126 RepID=UPI003D32A5B8
MSTPAASIPPAHGPVPTQRIAVIGLGRMGKLFLRAAFDAAAEGRGIGEIVLVSDRDGTAADHAHLLEFDTVQRQWSPCWAEGDTIHAGGGAMRFVRAGSVEDLPLDGIDLVVECTGARKDAGALQPYWDAGVPRALVSAPVKDGGALNIAYGVNHGLYDPAQHRLVTAASCTTNCLAPVVKVLHEAFGIRHGSFTTIHDVTNTQVIVDRWHKDLRRARGATAALIPTTSGSAKAIGAIFPELNGRLHGHAVRVPLTTGSLTDCAFELAREADGEEINAAFRAAATDGPLAGILGLEDRPLVSTDFCGDARSAIVDGPSTFVIGGTQAKIYAWYDNEWGYVNRMVDIARMMGAGR